MSGGSLHHHVNGRVPKLLTHVPAFSIRDTVATARQAIDAQHEWESVNYVYVVDRRHKLIGVLSIKELLRAPRTATLGSICTRDPVTVREQTAPERVAVLAIHHGIKSVPVVNRQGILRGVIGTDDILSILQRAGIDDAIRYSGIHLEHRGLLDVLHGRVGLLVRRRLPWLLIGLGGGMLASAFVGHFEGLLRDVVELAFFTPAIVYMGAAVGNQTQTLLLRSMTIGEVRVWKFFWKEIVVDACIGAVIGAVAFAATSWLLQDMLIAAIVGISMFGAVLSSGIVAIVMTVLLSARRHDPALGVGPFATIVQDLVSLSVYFSVATLFILLFGQTG